MLSGLWLGFRLYGRFDEAAFRKLILILLFISGSALLVRHVDVSMIVHLFRQ